MVVVWILISALPLAFSLWALLDAARRPAWAWSLAGRSQLVWMTALGFGLFLLFVGAGIAAWYLMRVRPAIARVERGNFVAFEGDD